MRALPALVLSFVLPFAACERPPARSTAPLAHDVYVWQRAHTAPVADALRAHGAAFHSVATLAAEVSWKKSAAGPVPGIARVPLDWSALASAPRVGLALRINTHPGPFARDDASARTLVHLARTLLAEAEAQGVRPTELQIDFDAATGKLAGYREWLIALRAAIAPLPLVFTALPAWLRSAEFPALARATDGFVLQVHSLTRPARADAPFALCDSGAALAAIDHAARLGVPFRVALPTYGYTLAFATDGRFAGLSAEGPQPAWRDDFSLREVRAEPAPLAALVRTLGTEHPAALTGIIWYRLPISGDRLNWSWPTLAAVMAGRAPTPQLVAQPRPDGPGLFALTITNTGDGDFTGPVHLTARWHDAEAAAADALDVFAITTETPRSLRLASPAFRLAAGESRPAGWLRLPPSTAPHVSLEN